MRRALLVIIAFQLWIQRDAYQPDATGRKSLIRRRHLLQAFTTVLAGCAIVERANAQPPFDRKQCKGQNIEVNCQLSPRRFCDV